MPRGFVAVSTTAPLLLIVSAPRPTVLKTPLPAPNCKVPPETVVPPP